MRPSPTLVRILAVIAILSLIALPVTAGAPALAEPAAGDQSIRQATMPPALDGDLSDWDGVPLMVLDLDTRAPNSSVPVERSDALYTLQMLKTADALYLGFHARDDKLVADSGTELHKDDSLRFSVDGNMDGIGGAPSDHAYRIRVDTAYNDNGAAITALTAVTRTIPGGYNMEVRIPATALALPFGSASFKFNWAAGDDDNGGGLDTFYLHAGDQIDYPEPSWPTATFNGEAFTPLGLLEAGRWEWYGGGSVGAVYAGSGGNVWAAGNGVWRTANNGTNWNRSPLLANAEISEIRFWDANRGLAVAENKVYLTEDAGATWRLSFDAGVFYRVRKLVAASTDAAWLVVRWVTLDGSDTDGHITRTRDGGASWQVVLMPSNAVMEDVAAVGADRAWVLASPYKQDPCKGRLYRTVDAGANWTPLCVGDNSITAQLVSFSDSLTGWIVGAPLAGGYYSPWRTTDGGDTWQKQALNVESVSWLIAFDAKNAWLASGKQLFRTTDGVNWYKISDSAPDKATFRSASEGWGVKGRAIQKTTNGGATWTTVYTLPDPPLARWWDHLRGWRISGGVVDRTVDGGGTWQTASTGLPAVDHMQMVTPLIGWTWHDASLGLRKTTDGGLTWTQQTTGSDALLDLQFVSANHGWVRDSAGNVRRTTNGGASWASVATLPRPAEQGAVTPSLYFVTDKLGLAGMRVGHSGSGGFCNSYYSRTTDGLTWSALQPGPSGQFAFGAPQTGWGASGCLYNPGSGLVDDLWKSSDGGASWVQLAHPGFQHVSLHAQDVEQLFAFGSEVAADKSSDGGSTFERQRAESNYLSLRSRLDRIYHEEPSSPAPRMIYRNAEIPAYRALQPPRIDGNLDDWGRAWETSLKVSNAATVNGGIPTPLESSAVLRAVWDANNLYIAALVYDDEIYVDTRDKPWHDDAVEISLDPAHDHINLAPDSDRQYLVNAEGEQYLWGSPTSGLEIGRQQTANGYILEIRIPKQLVPSLNLQPGGLAGFNFSALDDVDGGNAETRLFWTGTTTSRSQADWGQIRFSAIDAGIQPSDGPTPTPTATATPPATHTPTPSATPPGQTGFALGGRVWHDKNANGAVEPGEPGLYNVTVRLFRAGSQIGETMTDSLGSYVFPNLLPGAYILREQQPRWLPLSSTMNEIEVAITGGPVTVNFGDWEGLQRYLPVILR